VKEGTIAPTIFKYANLSLFPFAFFFFVIPSLSLNHTIGRRRLSVKDADALLAHVKRVVLSFFSIHFRFSSAFSH
jgi:hypothetical protein